MPLPRVSFFYETLLFFHLFVCWKGCLLHVHSHVRANLIPFLELTSHFFMTAVFASVLPLPYIDKHTINMGSLKIWSLQSGFKNQIRHNILYHLL